MEHQEGYFKDAQNSQIYYQYWLPSGELKATLLIAHGLAEHSGRYMNVVNHLVPQGYAVYGFDLLGHGKSAGMRTFVKRFEDFVETLKLYFDKVCQWQPNKPIFLLGHSMGGLISALYLLDSPDQLAGAVMSSPGIKVHDTISPVTIFAGKLLAALVPKFRLIQLEAAGISRDPKVVEAYVNDPLVYTGKISVRLTNEMLKAMQRITTEASKITLPLLIVQGGADKLVDPNGAQILYNRVSSADKTLKIYPNLYHEVFNEPERAQVLGDVQAWLAAHTP